MNKFLLYVHEKSKFLYLLLYMLAILIFIVVGSFVPYVYKSVAYPICYKKVEMIGKIEDILLTEENVIVKRRDVSMPQYYFEVDDKVILVYPSDVREHEIGDDFTYYLYVSENKEIADCNDYSMAEGILGVVVITFICYANFFIVWRGPKKKKCDEPEKSEIVSKINYNEMTAKELYELCQERKIYVLESKKRNKEFLKKCLRSEDSSERWLRTQEEKQFRSLLIFLLIKLTVLCFVAYALIETVYYLIYILL